MRDCALCNGSDDVGLAALSLGTVRTPSVREIPVSCSEGFLHHAKSLTRPCPVPLGSETTGFSSFLAACFTTVQVDRPMTCVPILL